VAVFTAWRSALFRFRERSANGRAADVTVADPKDYEVLVTYSYNFTISQALPWKSLFEIAYVGSKSKKLLMGGGSGASDCGSGCNFINQNKVPLGAGIGGAGVDWAGTFVPAK
jgi:hypothetical protein